ncbi:hypothetical protein Goari_000419 [Gossypium aridum]|uniref:Uncharacterized protein n=1 Tax=Gossypium aridum TaxID=34290 RepID=A0A7J8YGL0_GOSAI|nr:hypothetical protein [Gossypium aridum]MBA0698723.1 hypothetical protein [Gossypium aridum]
MEIFVVLEFNWMYRNPFVEVFLSQSIPNENHGSPLNMRSY